MNEVREMDLGQPGRRGVKAAGSKLSLLIAAGIGAAVMFLLDSNRGTRRRHLLADKARRALRVSGRELHNVTENAKNHAIGRVTEARRRLRREDVDDVRLVERVRAELGHHVERARAIEVFAENGRVTLCGAVPFDQIERAAKTASSVRGVRDVDNQLVVGAVEQGAPAPEA